MIKLSWQARGPDEATYERHVEFARELRLDGIDFNIQGLMSSSPDYLRQIKLQCLKAGLYIGYILSGVSLVGPEDERSARMARARTDVDVASYMGAQMVHVFARHKWPNTVEEQESLWGPMIADFKEICDYAAEKGVILGFQNHDHGSFAMTADQVLRILRETYRENLTFIMDTGQWLGSVGGSPRGWRDINVDIYKDYMERTAPHASYVRAKIYKIDNGWEEWLDYPRILKILQAVEFNGSMSIVFEGGQPPRNRFDEDECLRLASKHLRDVIALSYL